MTTKPTEEQRIEFLTSLKKVIEGITEELESTKNSLAKNVSEIIALSSKVTSTALTVEQLSNLWISSNDSVKTLNKQLSDFKEEVDRFKQYSKGIDETLEGKFTVFKERLENLSRTLDILETGIKGIRETDLDRINEKIKDIPSLEIIRRELSNSTSPLVTKNDFSLLAEKVSNIDGAVSSHFRNNLIGLFLALVTIIGTNVVAYYTFASKVDSIRMMSPVQNTPSSPKIPTSTNTATPSSTKPTP
ncbi:MAG: hypothetical protein WBV73_10430 [Phormidium sp.]